MVCNATIGEMLISGDVQWINCISPLQIGGCAFTVIISPTNETMLEIHLPCLYVILSTGVKAKRENNPCRCSVYSSPSSSYFLYPLTGNCAYVILATSVEFRIISAKASYAVVWISAFAETTDFVDCSCKPFFWDRFLKSCLVLMIKYAHDAINFVLLLRFIMIKYTHVRVKRSAETSWIPSFLHELWWFMVGPDLLTLQIGTVENRGCSNTHLGPQAATAARSE